MMIIQAQIIINQFNNLSTNQQVHMAAPVVNYFISSFEGNINPGYPQGIKLYLQETKYMDKEANKVRYFSFKFQRYYRSLYKTS